MNAHHSAVIRWGAGLLLALLADAPLFSASVAQTSSADEALAAYFKSETGRLTERCLADFRTLEDWTSRRTEYRRQAAEMLGLWPAPPRTSLEAVVTGRLEQDSFAVEKLHFQSMPGLYVTANLYLPKGQAMPAPAILYLCGHGPVITNGVSYGNKVSYQHHGIWFARHGYVCLVIDTLQYGEILGLHHGTYREGQWWWNARGYTPAGVEAWNSIRALDYLSTRPEVDTNRFGVTGRSGGGSYSWALAALDDRVKAIAPVAGITDLRNQVVDGAVEGHCDCMFFVNTYRWDYPQLAALCAPRPLLLVNTDSDTIFPLDGVLRTHAHLRRLYALYRATNHLGLVIAPGPHKDTQDLQVPVFRWFNRHLKGEDSIIEVAAVKLLTPPQLKVFETLPADAINTNAQLVFVPPAPTPPAPASDEARREQHENWRAALREKCFAGWPTEAGPPEVRRLFRETARGVVYEAFEIGSQPEVGLCLYVMSRSSSRKDEPVVLRIAGTNELCRPPTLAALHTPSARVSEVASAFGLEVVSGTGAWELLPGVTARACLWPRGCGPDVWSGDARRFTHLRRRFMLLGQTLEGMRVWDIRRAAQSLRTNPELKRHPLWLEADGSMGINVLFASLFEPDIARLELGQLPRSLRDGPDYLNVLKILDLPQAVEMATARCRVEIK